LICYFLENSHPQINPNQVFYCSSSAGGQTVSLGAFQMLFPCNAGGLRFLAFFKLFAQARPA